MSWTDYCLNHLVGDGKTIKTAAVFAFEDQVLGYAPDFYQYCADPSTYDYASEVNTLVAALNNPAQAASSGIVVGGVHYMFVNSHVEDGSPLPFLCGIAGDCGVTVRCTKAVVLVVVSASGASVQADLQSYKAAQELIINDS